jgi:RHS repeat-associated protein
MTYFRAQIFRGCAECGFVFRALCFALYERLAVFFRSRPVCSEAALSTDSGQADTTSGSVRALPYYRRRAPHERFAIRGALLALVFTALSADALTLTAVQSRKAHGATGDFDIPIDTSQTIGGLPTVESRVIGAGHQIVFQFDGGISRPGTATATDEKGLPVGTVTASVSGENDVVVTLTNVPDVKFVTLSLVNVNGSLSPPPVSIGFMVGDVNNTLSVNSSDISGVKARSGQTTTSLNFKFDVNLTGSINSSDISAIKARSGTVMPIVPAASAQIAAARAATDGATTLPVANLLVTYVKPLIGADPAGFFVQSQQSGPALFIAVDPATLNPIPAVGDRVSFTITSMATVASLRQATSISGFARLSAGNAIAGLVQNVSTATDLVSNLISYESELITVAGTISGAFQASGSGYQAASFDTVGLTGSLQLRIPSALVTSLSLTLGCQVTLSQVPMWRFNATPQVSGWTADDLTSVFCVPPVTLTVSKTGSGSGTVTSTGPGINCGADCTESYVTDAVVTLIATATAGSSFTGWGGACSGTGTCTVTMSGARTVTAGFTSNSVVIPPDPTTIAPPLSPTGLQDINTATAFLYTGANPIQTGVAPGTIVAARTAVLRGRVETRDAAPIPGVKITILSHPEFGQTFTRADGAFDLVVNGGGQLTVNYQAAGFLPVQRAVVAPWQDYAWLPDVVMNPFDSAVTTIAVNAGTMQTARGNPVTDAAGTRQATVLFPSGTTATMVMPDGGTQPLTSMNFRATEYTVGDAGPRSMPASLPPSSGYTYAVELSLDEVVAAGGTEVRFNQPLPAYVENFLGFPTGSAVPSGYYDRQKGQWIASANGRVIKILSIANGLADVDIDGTGVAAGSVALAALGITADERARLAQLYGAPLGQVLWRIPVTHFTPWDWNYPFGPPLDAISPPKKKKNKPPVKRPTRRCGSVIGCEEQTLGESIPVTGTPWSLHYQSERTPGRSESSALTIPVSEASVPASLISMRVQVNIAGRSYQAAYAAAPNIVFPVLWDGRDAYGRALYGEQTATVRIDYVYPIVYYPVRSDLELAFARSIGSGATIDSPRGVYNYTYSQTWTEKVYVRDFRNYGHGGWSLSVRHAYDPIGRQLLLGNGEERRAAALSQIVDTVAGNGSLDFAAGFLGENGPATAARLTPVQDIAVGPDGSLYIVDNFKNQVRRVRSDGIISTLAGRGEAGSCANNQPVISCPFRFIRGIAAGPDGSLYIADEQDGRIWRVNPDAGGLTTASLTTAVAGNGQLNYSGDGGPATSAAIQARSIALGPDGSLFMAGSGRIRRVGSDGVITTVAGNGADSVTIGDGGPATAAKFSINVQIAVGPDGSLFMADFDNRRVRRIGTDGIITTVAGTGASGSSGDGGPATAATFTGPGAVAVAPDGTLFIQDGAASRIRRVGPDGIITTVAGTGEAGFGGDIGPAAAAVLGDYGQPSSKRGGLAVGPDNRVYLSDQLRVRALRPVLPASVVSDLLLPSEDGREVYVFTSSGRHLRTLDALTGSARYQFGYNAAGYLTSVTDDSGNVTTIERTGATATAIVAAGGQRTTLASDPNGWLQSATNPAGEAHTMTYSADGLLQTFTDPRNKVHRFTYDALGRLTKDEDPAGGSTTLVRTELPNGYIVAATSALGRTDSYRVEQLANDAVRRTVTSTSGTTTTTLIGADDSEVTTYPDGTTETLKYAPDPRWGMLAPVVKNGVITTAGGRTRTVTATRTATLSDPANLLSLSNLTDTVTDNGAVSTSVYASSGTTRTLTETNPAGRISTTSLDALGRIAEKQVFGLDAVSYTYDSRGLISTITEGTGAGARTITLTYNAKLELTGVTDALGRSVGLAYDSAGRLVTSTLPGARTVTIGYDASGNRTSLTPPGKSAHVFAYSNVDGVVSYTPPDVGSGTTATQYSVDADNAPTRVTRLDGQLIDVAYDAAGRPASVSIARGPIAYSYSPTTDRLTGITAPGGLALGYSHDSDLLTGVTWSGAVSGATAYTYNNDRRVTAETVNGGNSASFTYTPDGLLSSVGSLTLTRNAQSGLLSGSTLGNVTDSFAYNTRAERSAITSSYNAAAIYSATYTRDALGRVTQLVETIGGGTTTFVYDYDAAGRLIAVTKDAVPFSSYSYDLNGNRIARIGPTASATYDAQDRLVSYGSTTYTYTANGERLGKLSSGQSTAYQYDALGNLLQVTLPNATVIDYLIDGENRRIGKKVNGVLVQGFLYQNALRPVAELDGSNALVSRFVYGTRVNVPDYMIKGGVTYRIITDQLGSPRLVVDVATGNIAQRIDYDEFGLVLNDSSPGFQPFGFAGGLYDKDTQLVRFGARDYDAETGRWTAKDPIRFAGKDTNLYAYAGGDPVNFADFDGLCPVGGRLFSKSHDLRLSRKPNAAGDRFPNYLPVGTEVTFLGYENGFAKVSVTLPDGTTEIGYSLPSNFSTNKPPTEITRGDLSRPLNPQAFASSGAGTKG